MRVVHLLRKYNPDQWGGTETAIQRLFVGLREHDVESAVYCPALDHAPARDPLKEDGCEIRRFRAFVPILGISEQRKRQLISVGGNLMSFDLYSMLNREREASVIHTHTLGRIGAIARTVAKRRKLPFVVTIHGGVLDLPQHIKNDFNKPIGGWEWGRFFGLVFQSHRLFPEADAIVTCNANEARLLQEKHPDKRIVVQPHGVPLQVYEKDSRAEALKAFPEIHGKQVLLCMGRIDAVKNQRWLIEQAPRFLNRHPETMLVLAGACTDEAYGTELKNRIRQLGIEKRVLITGGLPPNDPRLIGLLQEAEVLLVPSQSETFGIVILEAWATGTMVLSSKTSGGTTLIRHGENGWLFDLDNPQSFHEPLDHALMKTDLARRIIRRGCDQVNTEYNVTALAGRMKRLYEELIEEKNALRADSRRRYQRADTH
jgi:Glycosyltransferase